MMRKGGDVNRRSGVFAAAAAASVLILVSVATLRGQAPSTPRPPMAEEVFKNIQVLKGRTAGQLVQTMNAYGRALTLRCTSCHVAQDWASDSLRNKQRARIMQTMVNDINATHMPKMNAQRPPTVSCMTCHHGLQNPNQSFDASLPQPAAPPGRGGGAR